MSVSGIAAEQPLFCVLEDAHKGAHVYARRVTRDVMELHLHPLVAIEGIEAALWLYDKANDEYQVIMVKSGRLAWVPSERLTVDPSSFVDQRKVQEKQLGAYPGELGFEPKDEDDDD